LPVRRDVTLQLPTQKSNWRYCGALHGDEDAANAGNAHNDPSTRTNPNARFIRIPQRVNAPRKQAMTGAA
jgi:hypothetical protein